MGYDPEYFIVVNNTTDKVDDSLLCVICHMVYDTPMVLDPCGHSFCRDCVAELLDTGHENCPVCRTRMMDTIPVVGDDDDDDDHGEEEDEIMDDENYEHGFRRLPPRPPVRRARARALGVPPNRALTSLINNMTIHCLNNKLPLACKLSKLNALSMTTLPLTDCCFWTGKVSEFGSHDAVDCPLSIVTCPIAGCDWQGHRHELTKHNTDEIENHTLLIMESKVAAMIDTQLQTGTMATRLNDLQQQLNDKEQQLQLLKARFLDNWLSSFFRDWIFMTTQPTNANNNNDVPTNYFHNFVVYRPIKYLTLPIKQLIVGIPGPTNTDWEDGLYPLLLTFSPDSFERKEPPKCEFPTSFFHPNVYEGNIQCNTLIEFEGFWDPSISLPELFFCIQQLLAHPNHRGSHELGTSVYDPIEYKRTVRDQAEKYSENGSGNIAFLELAMIELQSKIDPDYKKRLESWENCRWENLESVRWKGRRSFQQGGGTNSGGNSSGGGVTNRGSYLAPPLEDNDLAVDDIDDDDDGDVQLIMTTNSNSSLPSTAEEDDDTLLSNLLRCTNPTTATTTTTTTTTNNSSSTHGGTNSLGYEGALTRGRYDDDNELSQYIIGNGGRIRSSSASASDTSRSSHAPAMTHTMARISSSGNSTSNRRTRTSTTSSVGMTTTNNNNNSTNNLLRDINGNVCECSCCIVGSRCFLDPSLKMRYIFGEGG